MEKTPAASAMDWSIHLDKALRSNNPGKREESIQKIGARLEWWSKEPELSMAEYDMFGLVPGEDKLFANAILLRLADTFVSGDKHTKLCLVKIFLSELKQRKSKSSNRKNEGILLKHKIPNHLELLRRIKSCFSSGDEEVRAMSLVLFGCWSDFAKDNAEIRYLILSSLVSCNVLEVKAALFAAGCFCEFSYDFACVLLEMLVNMVSSSDMPIAGRLAGVRAFAKLGRFSALSTRAYEEGLKLILGSVGDEFVTNMLISLSIIASRSALLISRQVDLLFSYLTQDKSLSLRATSLRCLHIVLSRSRFRFSPAAELIAAIFNMLNGEILPIMQRDALHILYEILLSKMLSFSRSEMNSWFTKILTVVEIIMQSPLSNRLLAMHFVADISVKFTRSDMTYDGDDKNLASQAMSFLMSRITLLANSVLNLNQPDMEMEQEIWSLLKTVDLLLNECPNLGEFALNKLHLFIKCLLNEDHKTNWSKLVIRVSKLVVLCLKNVVKAGTRNTQVEYTVRLLVKDVCGCAYFDCYVHTIYYLLLHHLTSCHYTLEETEEGNSVHACLIKNEILVLESAKKLMAVKDNWSAYKIGKYAMFLGAWSTAAFIFGELIKIVHSDSCSQWLTCLTLLAYSEMIIQYCSSPKESPLLLNWLNSNRSSSLQIIGDLGETDKRTAQENLDVVCKILRSSKEMLLADGVTPSGQHYIQVQFLSLRANVREIVLHIYKLLGTNSFSNGQKGHLLYGVSLIQPLRQLSTRLMKAAREYDLIAMSFIGMDPTSTMIVSAHALSCSVVAFITGFSLFFQFEKVGSQKLQSNFHALLIHDLAIRLWHIDQETSKELWLLLKTVFGQFKSCSVPQSKTQRLENAYEVRSIIKICRFAAKGVAGIQRAAKRMHDNDDNEILMQIINDGLELHQDIIRNWLSISFRTPTYFFRVRPCAYCQLFAMNRDSGNGEKISVLTGHHLHLDLCLQLNNISPESRARITKLYCILQCTSFNQLPSQSQHSKSQMQTQFHDYNILELNDKLVKYMNNCDKDPTFDGQIAETIVPFRPNGEGQGFSTCMLNVSRLPLGTYKIKWHAGCLDIDGCYWSLNSLNSDPVFTIQKSL